MEIRLENEVYDLEIPYLRKLLHEHVENVFDKVVFEPEDEDYNDLEKIHELISAQDVNGLLKGFFCNGNIHFTTVREDEMLLNALKEAGYQVEKSNISRSLYAINDDGIEVRIADHKRPAVEQNGIWQEWEYDKEIIVKNNIIYGIRLQEVGFSKLPNKEFIFG